MSKLRVHKKQKDIAKILQNIVARPFVVAFFWAKISLKFVLKAKAEIVERQ